MLDIQKQITELAELLRESDNIVFFGGAGVSTESNIPDFRSTDGLYHQQYDYPPETILSHTFFMRNTEEFFRFYKAKMLMLDEPSLGLAPVVVDSILDNILAINQEGITILLVEQNVMAALEIADRAYVIETGMNVIEGDAKELQENNDIRKAYMGV